MIMDDNGVCKSMVPEYGLTPISEPGDLQMCCVVSYIHDQWENGKEWVVWLA